MRVEYWIVSGVVIVIVLGWYLAVRGGRMGGGEVAIMDDRVIKPDEVIEVQGRESWEDFVKPREEELKERLPRMVYEVTQREVTEQAFNNAYWDEKREGIYVDPVSGGPLFSSRDKYDSGTGWPSFVKPISDEFVVTRMEYKLILPRTEVRSRYGDSHLGHVFDDGPKDRGGKRYCMNSAAMVFVPREEMEGKGYGKWLSEL